MDQWIAINRNSTFPISGLYFDSSFKGQFCMQTVETVRLCLINWKIKAYMGFVNIT